MKKVENNLPLTEPQKMVWGYVLGYLTDNQCVPTRREIANKFGYTPQGAQDHLERLADKGYIRFTAEGKWRNYTIVQR